MCIMRNIIVLQQNVCLLKEEPELGSENCPLLTFSEYKFVTVKEEHVDVKCEVHVSTQWFIW
jgi:hypothetical protein